MKPRLHPWQKPRFMESALQVWLAIFIAAGLGVGIAGSHGWVAEPKEVLSYLTTIAGLYIAASGGTDAIRAGKCNTPPPTDDEPRP